MKIHKKIQPLNENVQIVTVEELHELASDKRVSKICLRSSVPGTGRNRRKQKEFSHWELQYIDGKILNVYV